MATKTKCAEVKSDGSRCKGWALTDSDRCFWHAPESARARAAARRKGGRNGRRRKVDHGPPPDAVDMEAIETALLSALQDAWRLEGGESRARVLVYVVQTMLKSIEVGELEARLEALEAIVHERYERP